METKEQIAERMAKARAAKTAKDEPKQESTETATPQTLIVSPQDMTQEERAIAARVNSESNEWSTVDQYATLDFSLAEDPHKLPESAQKLQDKKEFKFRWFTRTPGRVDEVKNWPIPLRWWPVNRVQPVAKAFDKNVDGATGAVHHLDQMLFFKPWWMWEKEQAHYNRIADVRGDFSKREEENRGGFELSALQKRMGDKFTGKERRMQVNSGDEVMGDEADFTGAYGTMEDSDLVVNE